MEKNIKRIYQIAAIYGFIVLVPQLFLGEKMLGENITPITHPVFFYGFTLVAIAWQFTFLLIASDIKRYRLIMLGTILEKAGFAVLCLYLFSVGQILPNIFLGGMIDLLLMFAFIFCFLKTEKV